MEKNSISCLFFLFMMCASLTFMACNEEHMEYGEAFIYMPQATTTGGVNALYNVPSGGGVMTYNFKAENGRINIILGVTRSGTFDGEDFSVEVEALKDQTEQLVASGRVRNAVPMEDDIYSLPSQVTVSNSNDATFYLSVDSATLINDLSYTGQNMVLAIGINNPTKYELSDKNTVVMVVLDVDAIRDHFFKYKEGFVYRKGTKLYLDGKEYQSASFSSFQLAGCGGGDELFSLAEVEALFASLPDNIMVRTWAFPGNKAHTDQLVQLAEKHRIKLVLVLGNGRSYCGHLDGASNGEWTSKTPEWYTEGFKGEFLAHVKDMATTYKDSPAIGMWEIINQPVDVDWMILKAFMNEVGKVIKENDPNHLVSSGTWAQWAYGGEANLQAIHDSNYIDAGTFQDGDSDIVESWHFPAHISAMNRIDKVAVVSDIDISGGDEGCTYTKEGRMEMVKQKFDHYIDRGASVVLVSSLAKTATDCKTFSTDDPIMRVIETYPVNE